MSHLPQALSLSLAAIAFGSVLGLGASPLVGQADIVVDPNNGPYKTITAALAVAKNTDVIRVKKGVYVENLTISGRAANIISIAASPTDVVLRGTTPASTPLTIRKHPAGSTSRFARMVIGSPAVQRGDAVSLDQSAGHIVFEEIQSINQWSFRNHRGTVSLTRCVIQPMWIGNSALVLDGVSHAFLHQCWLQPHNNNTYFGWPGTDIKNSNVEFCRCNLRGHNWTSWSIVTYLPGGPAVKVTNSTCRISGLGSDTIVGGNGHPSSRNSQRSIGGSGIEAVGSTLTISSVRVSAGTGVTPYNTSAPNIKSTTSTIIRPAIMLPVVQNTKGFTRGGIETITLFGPANAQSLTCIALYFSPLPTPFGYLVLNPGGPVLSMPATLNAAGQATHTLDLRGLPSTFAGAPYLMQSATLAPNNIFALSSPQNGVIATR